MVTANTETTATFGHGLSGELDSVYPNYRDKVKPVLVIGNPHECIASSDEGEFNYPLGVAVDIRTDNIYVVDQLNCRVQVFNKQGGYLFKFGDRNGAGKMEYPLFVAVDKDYVIVTQNDCLIVFDLSGNFITQIGGIRSEHELYTSFYGFAICKYYGDIYVCDFSNRRVQIYSHHYPYTQQFGREIHGFPSCIRLTKDAIDILSNKTPFLNAYSYDLNPKENQLIYSISSHLTTPNDFYIDTYGQFIFSENCKNSVLVFDDAGNLLHRVTDQITFPMSVTHDSTNRIIVSCHKHCVVIF